METFGSNSDDVTVWEHSLDLGFSAELFRRALSPAITALLQISFTRGTWCHLRTRRWRTNTFWCERFMTFGKEDSWNPMAPWTVKTWQGQYFRAAGDVRHHAQPCQPEHEEGALTDFLENFRAARWCTLGQQLYSWARPGRERVVRKTVPRSVPCEAFNAPEFARPRSICPEHRHHSSRDTKARETARQTQTPRNTTEAKKEKKLKEGKTVGNT